jgi:pSer/pThr/pTyr-binding forkhead associated (FHA) protein
MAGKPLAKLVWSGREHVLLPGATATIGRATDNDLTIIHKHVSRHHAIITFRSGVFHINDLGSVNGTFVNDLRVERPHPLVAGDVIRLYEPVLTFQAATDTDLSRAQVAGRLTTPESQASRLQITSGAQEGETIPLILDEVRIGRATQGAPWEIALRDPAVSRPHAALRRRDDAWFVCDLKSVNGTLVNGMTLQAGIWQQLVDGDSLSIGTTRLLFRGE